MGAKTKCLTTQEANEYLGNIDMTIGKWNQITDSAGDNKSIWKNYQAPKDSRELFNFSNHIAEWLPKGDWKIFQIDNSGGLDAVEAHLFGRLLFGSENMPSLVENRTFLFEFGNGKDKDRDTELLIANLIYVFLLFECHGQVVSSNCSEGQRLSIQDGFAYFLSRGRDLSSAESLLKNFERNPLMSPEWIIEIIADIQERDINKKR